MCVGGGGGAWVVQGRMCIWCMKRLQPESLTSRKRVRGCLAGLFLPPLSSPPVPPSTLLLVYVRVRGLGF